MSAQRGLELGVGQLQRQGDPRSEGDQGRGGALRKLHRLLRGESDYDKMIKIQESNNDL